MRATVYEYNRIPVLAAVIAVFFLVTALIGGIHRKTVCAMLGTISGIALSMAFTCAAQYSARIDGLRSADIEPLLQLRQSGTPIGLK